MASAFGILCIMILVRLFILIECLVLILIYSKKCFVRQFESNNYLTFFVKSNQHNFTLLCIRLGIFFISGFGSILFRISRFPKLETWSKGYRNYSTQRIFHELSWEMCKWMCSKFIFYYYIKLERKYLGF